MHISELIITAAIAVIFYKFAGKFYKFYAFKRKLDKLPGPTFGIPHFGIIFAIKNITSADRLDWFTRLATSYKDGYFRTWIGTRGSVHICKPEHIEVICRSHTEITKSEAYDYLRAWLGQGLITSTGSQWFHSRKLITPAFHFSILDSFAEVMIEKAAILTDCIEREIKIHGDKPINIFDLTVRAALDIICETAMGVNVHAQEAIESKYIQAVHTISSTVVYRFLRPWLKIKWLFDMTAQGKAFNEAVKETHDLCTSVIKSKQDKRKLAHNDEPEVDEITGKAKRKAFLDILLEANEKEENPLTVEEMRDQTNTFLFAGHDTTGGLVSWALFCLGNELDVQKKVHEELDEVLGEANDHDTLKELPNLKYLERVIKEVLRLYPSVTDISRSLMNDLKIGDYTVPKGARLSIHMYVTHRDPSLWPDPLRFDPDRFLPDNSKSRHPYAYLPFSAGPRNCIGQKYAMLEAKIILAQILRKFSVKSVENHSTIKKCSEIILRPVDGIYVHMKKRSNP